MVKRFLLGTAAAVIAIAVMATAGMVAQTVDEGNPRLQATIRAAERGNAKAQFNLGDMYRIGEGVPQDQSEALRWWRMAAEQGHAGAQSTLGVMYEAGDGIPQDYLEAVRWWRMAAEQGEFRAQYNLNVMYAAGQGVPQDYVNAHVWFNLAAAQGHEIARTNRDKASSFMTPDQLAEAQRLAREWMAERR